MWITHRGVWEEYGSAMPHLIEVRRASLSWCVCLFVVHCPVLANEYSTLEDLDHLHGDIKGDGDEIAVQNEAGYEGVNAHHTRSVGVGIPFCTIWCQVPVSAQPP